MIGRACSCSAVFGQCDNCAEAEAAQEAEDHAAAHLEGEPPSLEEFDSEDRCLVCGEWLMTGPRGYVDCPCCNPPLGWK